MITLAWIISVVVALWLGYHLKNLWLSIGTISDAVRELRALKSEVVIDEVEPPSSIIDPLDPIQTARYEHEKMMREMNPPNEQ